MDRAPIFFAWTRSFWLGIFPALLTAIDMAFLIFGSAETAGPIAAILAAMLSMLPLVGTITAEDVTATMQALAPLYALIVGQQRMHAARPYTIDPRALK